MKKLLLMIAAVAALAFVACDKNANANAEEANEDSIAIENLINAPDSAAAIAALDALQKKAEDLKAAGDTIKANELLAKVKAAIDANKDKLTALVPAIGEVNLLDKAKEAADSVAAAGKDAAAEVVDAAKEKVAEAAEAGKEKAAEAVDKAAAKGAEAVDKGADDAKNAAKGAAEDAKKKLGL